MTTSANSPPNAAVWYQRDGYDSSGQVINGRRAAGEALLKALLTDPAVPEFVCLSPKRADYDDFLKQAPKLMRGQKAARWVRPDQADALARVGTVYLPGPGLDAQAWVRRRTGERGYSLAGVFYTISSAGVMDAIGQLLLAPVREWDAVVCISHSMKDMVVRELNAVSEYLAERFGHRPKAEVQLPVIPLGVNAAAFDPDTPAARASRQRWRAKLKIAPDDLCVLYFGRLSFHAKAHPLPMYQGLGEAAKKAPGRVHLIQAGVFASEAVGNAYRQGAAEVCPDVTCHYMDGHDPAAGEVWFAADLFTSLSDNIQESFGITPVEAMAAGLPVVGTDWDGYRETVRDGVDGILVPTWQPRPGSGYDLAVAYASGAVTYDRYVCRTSQCTAVDAREAAKAYTALLTDPALRKRMGQAGRARAKEVFDWPRVIDRYRELWAELARIRGAGTDSRRGNNPFRDDPFTLFAAYPTHQLSEATRVEARPGATVSELLRWLDHPLTAAVNGPADGRKSVVEDLMKRCLADGATTVEKLAAAAPKTDVAVVIQLIGWLAKCDLVRLANPTRV